MPSKFFSSSEGVDRGRARLEQAFDSGVHFLAQIPLHSWKFLVILLLVLWLSQSLARLFWMLIPAPVIPPAAVALTTPSAAGGMDAHTVDIDQLKSLSIFGEAQPGAVVEESNNISAIEAEASVDTQLNLILVGVVASNEDAGARAIIAANGRQDVYAPGAELPVGRAVTLARVLDRRVILDNNGRLESLWLDQDGAGRRTGSSNGNANYVPPERSWSGDMEPAIVDTEMAPNASENSSGVADASPAEIDLPADVSSSISDVVAMSIHREGGQIVGYRIRPGRNAEQFTALGLQANDIVTAVNGVPLNNPGKIMEIYRNMSNATSANLEIKRGESTLSIDIALE